MFPLCNGLRRTGVQREGGNPPPRNCAEPTGPAFGRPDDKLRDEAIQFLLCCFWIASLSLAMTMTARGGNTMNDSVNRQILLVEKPAGKLGPEHFKMSKGGTPEPKDREPFLRLPYI